jgi:hypothetical protein
MKDNRENHVAFCYRACFLRTSFQPVQSFNPGSGARVQADHVTDVDLHLTSGFGLSSLTCHEFFDVTALIACPQSQETRD